MISAQVGIQLYGIIFQTSIILPFEKSTKNYHRKQLSTLCQLSKLKRKPKFFSFLSKEIEACSSIQAQKASKKAILIKIIVEPLRSDFLKVVNTKNIPPDTKKQSGNEKQHNLQKNSSFVKQQFQATKLHTSQSNGSSKTMKKITKLLKSSIYLNYDIISSSGIYSEQKHNIFMEKKWNTAKKDQKTYTQTYFNASSTKTQMNRTDFKAIHKKPRLKRMQTVPVNFQLTLSMTLQ